MINSLNCTQCGALLRPEQIDHQRQIATCSSCGRLVDVRTQLAAAQAAATSAPTPPARPAVELPPGMSLQVTELPRADGSSSTYITIRRRWLRAKHWRFLIVCTVLSVILAQFWLSRGPGEEIAGWLIVATLFILMWDYNVATMFVNTTFIRADAAGVRVTHGPLPSPFGLGRKLERSQIKQLFSSTHGKLYAVRAQTGDKKPMNLVAPLVSREQALFVEQQLEKVLGLVDFPVPGELDRTVSVSAKPVAGAKQGATIALLVPLLVIGPLALFYMVSHTEVAGQLQADGKMGSWVFTPDECTSGQREGFGGVVLSSSQDAARVVRVVKDPVKGALLVVAEASGKTHLFEPDSCTRLDLVVQRTDTSINEIWAVNGRASVNCTGLSGNVTFEGCH